VQQATDQAHERKKARHGDSHLLTGIACHSSHWNTAEGTGTRVRHNASP